MNPKTVKGEGVRLLHGSCGTPTFRAVGLEGKILDTVKTVIFSNCSASFFSPRFRKAEMELKRKQEEEERKKRKEEEKVMQVWSFIPIK